MAVVVAIIFFVIRASLALMPGAGRYGTGRFLRFVVDAGITPYIPVWDKTTRGDGTFSRADFAFDKERNIYTCPAGKTLTTTGHVSSDHAFRYLASIRDCKACPLKAKC